MNPYKTKPPSARGRPNADTRFQNEFFCDDTLPESDSFDLLLIMGGTMNIYEEKKFPWLVDEKAFIADVLLQGQASVLGVCLGAQLMADCLGGVVTRNAHREIGWFPVELTDEARQSPHFRDWPQTFTPFHWHGDTFAIPHDSLHIAQSMACAHQAFVFGDRAVGLQFHLEYYTESIEAMLECCEGELDPQGRFCQSPETIRRNLHNVTKTLLCFIVSWILCKTCVAKFFSVRTSSPLKRPSFVTTLLAHLGSTRTHFRTTTLTLILFLSLSEW
jgi:GMP synthase (glutamine-hydrolysing)